MVTPLGKSFSTNEKTMLQHDNQTFESTTETLVISFDQEKLEEIVSQGDKCPLSVRKYREVIVAKAPLVISLKEPSCKAK